MALTYHGRFFFPNRIDSGDLSGGAWVEAMPLTNLQDRLLSRVARSISLDPAHAQFTIDFGKPLSIGALGLIGHNISLSGRIEVQASNGVDFSTLKFSETFDAWPALVGADWDLESLSWNSRNFWRGTYAPEDIEGQTAKSIYILESAVIARYWRVIVRDAGNTDGHIDIGRGFWSETFLQPRINYSYGASFGYETATTVETSLGGVEFFDPRESIMTQRVQFGYLGEEEASRALQLVRRAGIHREIVFVPDPSDKRYGAERIIYCRLRQLNPLEQAAFQLNSMAFELKELR